MMRIRVAEYEALVFVQLYYESQLMSYEATKDCYRTQLRYILSKKTENPKVILTSLIYYLFPHIIFH
jgi:hypothetical protein